MLVNYKTANCPTTVAAYESEPSVQKCINFRNIPLGYTNIEFRFSFFSTTSFSAFREKRINQKYFIAAFYEKKPEIMFSSRMKNICALNYRLKKVNLYFCTFK